jgi:hypothetical protein
MMFENESENGLNQFEEKASTQSYTNDYNSDETEDPPLLEDLGISKINIS